MTKNVQKTVRRSAAVKLLLFAVMLCGSIASYAQAPPPPQPLAIIGVSQVCAPNTSTTLGIAKFIIGMPDTGQYTFTVFDMFTNEEVYSSSAPEQASSVSFMVFSDGSFQAHASVGITNQQSAPFFVNFVNTPILSIVDGNPDGSICPGSSITLQSSEEDVTWDTNVQADIDGAFITINYDNAQFGYTVSVTSNVCSQLTSNEYTGGSLVGLPELFISSTGVLCAGAEFITMEAQLLVNTNSISQSNGNMSFQTPPAETYNWIFEESTTISTTSTANAGIAGYYSVTVDLGNGCQLFQYINVINGAVITSNVDNVEPLCAGESVELFMDANEDISFTYWYYLQFNFQGTQNEVQIGSFGDLGQTVFNADTYYALYTTNNGACEGTFQFNVTTPEAPVAAVITNEGNLTKCPVATVSLSQNANGDWNFAMDNSTTVIVQAPGTYFVTTTNVCGITAVSNSIVITNIPPPAQPTITGASSNVCPNTSVELTSSASAYWYGPNGSVQTGSLMSVTVSTTGNYYAIVQNSCGSSTGSVAKMVTINTCNVAPGPQGMIATSQCGNTNQPANGYMYLTPTTGANGYTIKFYTIGSNTVYAQKFITGSTINFVGLNPPLMSGTQYHVTVTPSMISGPAGTESAKCLTGLGIPPTPQNIAPCNLLIPTCVSTAANAVVTTLNYVKSTAVGNAASYEFKFVNVNNASNSFTALQSTARVRAFADLPLLMPGATYAVSVRAKVGTVWAANFGTECYIKLPGSSKFADNTTNAVVINNFAINAYPNPFTSNATFNVTSEKNELVNIQLLDITGKVVFADKMQSNTNFNFADENVNAGIYFLQATKVDGSKKVIKIVKN